MWGLFHSEGIIRADKAFPVTIALASETLFLTPTCQAGAHMLRGRIVWEAV